MNLKAPFWMQIPATHVAPDPQPTPAHGSVITEGVRLGVSVGSPEGISEGIDEGIELGLLEG